MKLGDDTIVLVTREATGDTDRYGNDVIDDRYTPVLWCLVTPAGSSEPVDRSAPRVTGLDVLAPRGPADQIDAAAAVIFPAAETGDPARPWAGPRYEVDGDAGLWPDCVQARLMAAR